MSSDVESQLVEKLKSSKFSIQLDESTVSDNRAILMAYVRFIFFFWKGSTFSNAGSDGTQPASCVDIQNRQSTYSCGCPMYGASQNNVFCGLFCSATLAIRCRSKAPYVYGRAFVHGRAFRFIYDNCKLCEEMLFTKLLETDTTGLFIFDATKS